MTVKEKLRQTVEKALGELAIEGVDFSVERPADENRGDFSTNVGMVTGRGEEILKQVQDDSIGKDLFERVEMVGGFINFWLKDEYLLTKLGEMERQKEKVGESEMMKGKRVLVEYSSPNIAKRFSVGHLRSTIIGQALFNLFKACGADVTNDNHLGDWGTQFGMIIAAVEEKKEFSIFNFQFSKIEELEELYVNFNKRIEEDETLKEKAREAFARLESGDKQAREIWQKAYDISMKDFEEIYQKLGVAKFEHQNGESVYEKMMSAIIKDCQEKKIARLSQGAWIVEFNDLPSAILLKSNGTTTYFTRDLATIRKRLDDDDLKADMYVYEVGVEQTLHFRQVFGAAKLLWPEELKKIDLVHVAHGRLSLPEGKMSTRKGNTIKLEDLIGRAKDEAKDEVLGIGAIKYNELKRAPVMNYVFRWEEALNMEGNSAPYLMYAYVRSRSVLAKAKTNFQFSNFNFQINEDERSIVRWLVRFGEGEIVESCARNFAPQQMCAYLFELAKRFSGFYERNKVIGGENEALRLLIVKETGEVIKKGLELLGIGMVERM